LQRIVAILGPPATPEPDNFPAAVARFFLDVAAQIDRAGKPSAAVASL
jgi:hypothetical protein